MLSRFINYPLIFINKIYYHNWNNNFKKKCTSKEGRECIKVPPYSFSQSVFDTLLLLLLFSFIRSEHKLFVDTSKRHIHDKCGNHSSSSHIVDAYLGARILRVEDE